MLLFRHGCTTAIEKSMWALSRVSIKIYKSTIDCFFLSRWHSGDGEDRISIIESIYIYIHHLLVVYICICPELGAISHIFSHIRPEFGAKSTYICIYTPRVRDYIQQYSPEFGIYVFLTAMLEFPLNLSHFDCYFLMKNTNSTIVITPPKKTQTNKVQ